MLTRRSFTGMAAGAAFATPSGWLELFDGQSLQGWKASGAAASWQARDGLLVASGPVSHLFYTARSFRNFEFEVDVLTRPGANSGIYFHTAWQDAGFPKQGFEVQVNNTALGEGTYRERKRTGSLYGIRNVPQQLVNDNEWFRIGIAVRGKNVQVRVNGMLTVDYTEPAEPVLPPSQETGRFLQQGLFALQCHDPNSQAFYRNPRVRPLPDNEPTPGPLPEVDPTFRQIIELGAKNYPLVDWHVHLKPGLGLREALAKSRRDGLYYGISANCGRQSTVATEAAALAFLESARGQAAYIGLQMEGADWEQIFTPRVTSRADFLFNDGLIWTDARGRWTRIYRPADLGAIPSAEQFMDELVDRTVHLLTRTPMDYLGIPTFLPDSLLPRHEELWTPARMRRIVDAAAAHHVAIELNDRYQMPRLPFARMAKEAGCQFVLGSGNNSATDLGRCEYGLKLLRELQLKWTDLWLPTRRAVG